jgi:hypothetical protein
MIFTFQRWLHANCICFVPAKTRMINNTYVWPYYPATLCQAITVTGVNNFMLPAFNPNFIPG